MATPRTVAFHTLGCKLNYSETSSIKRQFEGQGYSAVAFDDGADIYVINTCSVTDFADRKCRKIVRDALKRSPEARVVMIGCYAQLKPDEIANIPGVDLVLGATEKFNVLNYIDTIAEAPGKGLVKAGELSELNSFEDAFSFGDRTRSFLKVQDGCNYKCTFCTIPQARGKSRSDTIANVVANARKIAEAGVKEIVLTGVNIGDFGLGADGKRVARFIDLCRSLDQVQDIERIRISSIEPNLCNDEVIDFVAGSERFMPHFHMPLQSGCNTVLKDMRRRYQRELYQDRVARIKDKMPHCCIGVDVIVGFPTEGDQEFLESYNFINELDISYLHVFTYSERANTEAAEMDASVPMNVRRERNKQLRILSDKKRRLFYDRHLGEERSVLFEESKVPDMMHGFTDNYIKVELTAEKSLIGTSAEVHLRSVKDNGNVAVSPVAVSAV